MKITWLPMTRPRYSPGRPFGPPRLVVLHATAGTWPGDRDWLRKGGADDPRLAVSCHYLIAPDGEIVQFVADTNTAWHTGASAWKIDGEAMGGSRNGVATLNWLASGIELSGANKADSRYPDAQLASAVELTRTLVERYQIPRCQLVRHCDIAPGRKTDPANFPWPAFTDAVYALIANTPHYHADSAILGTPLASPEQAFRYLSKRASLYDVLALESIVDAYVDVASAVGLDWVLAVAQMVHETGGLTSWWCARPRRNPAGIGVTGQTSATRPGPHWAHDGRLWREGVSFPAWTPDEAAPHVSSIEAHVGRLLAYSMKPGERWGAQVQLVDRALSVRELPLTYHGCAPTLRGLGGTWAVPGTTYAERIAAIAEAIRVC
jgi:N-acetyl-anhydromuramyl-L-alanine amidase AmpD